MTIEIRQDLVDNYQDLARGKRPNGDFVRVVSFMHKGEIGRTRIDSEFLDNDILALIPLRDGMVICNAFLKSLLNQTVKIGILPISRPKMGRRGCISRTFCKNLAKEQALIYDCDKYLFINSDLILPNNTDVEDMIKFLDENEKYGAVTLKKQAWEIDHADIACMLVRRYVLENVKFSDVDIDDCKNFAKSMKELNNYKEICYLDDRRMIDLYREG